MDFEKEAQRYPFDLTLVSFEADDQEYVVAFKDYPDIIGSGSSAEEAIAEAYGNLAVYLQYLSEEGKSIVPPSIKEPEEEPSGRVTLRMTKGLHAALIKRANKEGMSVNSVINDALGKYLYQSQQEDWYDFDTFLSSIQTALKLSLQSQKAKTFVNVEHHSEASTLNVSRQNAASYKAA